MWGQASCAAEVNEAHNRQTLVLGYAAPAAVIPCSQDVNQQILRLKGNKEERPLSTTTSQRS